MRRLLSILVLSGGIPLAGCEVLGGLAGAGAGAAIKQSQEGEATETFTQPLSRTRAAVLAALKRMQIEVRATEGERIAGYTQKQPVDVRLEPVTEKTTRMTVRIGEGLKRDRATAQEIVDQTKRVLGEAK